MQGAQRPQREQNLADLLADDAGNLRPEVADLVMRGRPQRRIFQGVQIPTRQIIIAGSLIFAFILGRIFIPSSKENKGHVQLVPEVQKMVQGNVQERFLRKPMQAPQKEMLKTGLGKGKVFGYNVNIRQGPSISSPIISKTNQNTIFQVLSFSDGWYQIMLGNNRTGYIFGAYLLPMDFNVSNYFVGVGENGKKLLLTEGQYEGSYQEILPSGQKQNVQKNRVRLVQ